MERPLDEDALLAIRDAQSIYGIDRIQLAPSLDALTVEYDASRLRAAEVEAILRRKGLPIQPMLPSEAA